MNLDSWTRRLDDHVLRPTGVLLVLAAAAVCFCIAAISSAIDGSWIAVLVYGVLAVLAAQAARMQGRHRHHHRTVGRS